MSNHFPTPSVATGNEASANNPIPRISCWISFGGNVGDVQATFDAGLALLSLHPQILLGKRSGIYGTAPVGSQAGQPFLNAICGLETQLSPRALLQVLQSVEDQLGRVRDQRWGPRTLDLDLISYGQEIVNEPNLVVPHPALTCRRFVLDPLVEVDPHWCHPQSSLTANQLVARLKRRPLLVRILSCPTPQIDKLATQLESAFPELRFVSQDNDVTDVISIQPECLDATPSDSTIDVSYAPGCILERLTSAFTAIFDVPRRICDWQVPTCRMEVTN